MFQPSKLIEVFTSTKNGAGMKSNDEKVSGANNYF